MFRKTVVGLAFLSISFFVNAASVETSYFLISKIRISSSTGNIYINPEGGAENKNASCTNQGLYAFHKDALLFDQIYASALAAATASKQVKIWISTNNNDCVNGYQRVSVIEVDF